MLTAPGEPADCRLGAAANTAAVTGTAGSHAELAGIVAALEEVPWTSHRSAEDTVVMSSVPASVCAANSTSAGAERTGATGPRSAVAAPVSR